MNKQKHLRVLFALFIVLSVVFGILLIIPDMRGNIIGRVGLWCGLVSQLLLAFAMYSEIRRIKKNDN
jgi:succinate-acetate transporter protein